jgi:hypothetical protein
MSCRALGIRSGGDSGGVPAAAARQLSTCDSVSRIGPTLQRHEPLALSIAAFCARCPYHLHIYPYGVRMTIHLTVIVTILVIVTPTVIAMVIAFCRSDVKMEVCSTTPKYRTHRGHPDSHPER